MKKTLYFVRPGISSDIVPVNIVKENKKSVWIDSGLGPMRHVRRNKEVAYCETTEEAGSFVIEYYNEKIKILKKSLDEQRMQLVKVKEARDELVRLFEESGKQPFLNEGVRLNLNKSEKELTENDCEEEG